MDIKTVKTVIPFIKDGKHREIPNKNMPNGIMYQHIITFTDGLTGPVFTQNPEAPYEAGDQVEAIRNENKGNPYYSVKKTTPFPKEEETKKEAPKAAVKTTPEEVGSIVTPQSLRETHIAIASIDKALAIYNQMKSKETHILSEASQKDIVEMAIDISKMITKVEKNVF